MLNHIGIDTLVENLQLQHNERGYVQAVANVAYKLLEHVDSLLEDALNGNSDRMFNFFTAVEQSRINPDDVVLTSDLSIYATLTDEIIPAIAETYEVCVTDVLEDFDVISDYYVQQQMIADLANHI
jgi:hypothetical protein